METLVVVVVAAAALQLVIRRDYQLKTIVVYALSSSEVVVISQKCFYYDRLIVPIDMLLRGSCHLSSCLLFCGGNRSSRVKNVFFSD